MKTHTLITIASALLVILFVGGSALADSGHDRSVGFDGRNGPAMVRGMGSMGFGMMSGVPMMDWGMHGRRGMVGYGGFLGPMMGGLWSFFVWRSVMWIVVLGIIGVVIWLIVRTQKQHVGSGTPEGESPLDIAKRRYAKGEISREEFENLKRDLQ
jgi:putative membrane protein